MSEDGTYTVGRTKSPKETLSAYAGRPTVPDTGETPLNVRWRNKLVLQVCSVTGRWESSNVSTKRVTTEDMMKEDKKWEDTWFSSVSKKDTKAREWTWEDKTIVTEVSTRE